MTIAVCKAFLVVLYFMHARYGARLTWIFIGAGVLWLAIMLGLTVSDVLTRPWLPVPPPWAAAAAGPDGQDLVHGISADADADQRGADDRGEGGTPRWA